MKKRLASILLTLAMLMGMLPAAAFPALAAPAAASSLQSTAAASGSTDAFGINTDTSMTPAESNLSNNPYGTTNWFTLFGVPELFIANVSDEELSYETRNYNNDASRKEGYISEAYHSGSYLGGSTKDNNENGYHFLATSPMDLYGTGKKEYVACLGLWENGGAASSLDLWISDKSGNRVSSNVARPVSGRDQLDHFEELDGYASRGFFAVAAGDFDGDGKDSIVVYVPRMHKDKSPCIWEYTVNGTTLEYKDNVLGGTIWDILNLRDGYGDDYDTPDNISYDNEKDSRVIRNTPQVDLKAADLDKDSIDELVITTSVNDTYASDVGNRFSRLFVYDLHTYSKTVDDQTTEYRTWKQSHSAALKDVKADSTDDKQMYRLRAASSDVGNVDDNTDFPEIVTAGWLDANVANYEGDSITDWIGTYITYCNSTDRTNGDADDHTPVGNYSTGFMDQGVINGAQGKLKPGYFSTWGHWDSDVVQPLMTVCCFAGHGVMGPEDVLIADTVFQLKQNQWVSGEQDGMQGNEDKPYQRAPYFDDNDKGVTQDGDYIINTNLVYNAVAGNFDGNSDGREQCILVAMLKQATQNDNFTKLVTYKFTDNDTTSLTTYDPGEYDDGEWKQVNAGSGTVSLCPIDIDNDGMVVKVNGVQKNWTDPRILALLESPPYFKEINEGDVRNSTTTYGKSEGSGEGESDSNGVTANALLGFEWSKEFGDLGFESGAGIESTIELGWSWETSKTETKEYSVGYDNDTGENTVVLYRRPVTTWRFIQKYSDQPLTISRKGTLAASMITVDEYNDIVENASDELHLDPIADDVLASPGNPFSYRSNVTATKYRDVARFGESKIYQGNGTITETISHSSETVESQTFDESASFTAYAIIYGARVGGGAGQTHSHTTDQISTENTTFSASVSCVNVPNYNFNWELAHWKETINGDEVPVLGYVLTNVTAPPSPPINLTFEDIGPHSATLKWQEGDRKADKYQIFQYIESADQYIMLGEVPGNVDSFPLTHLDPATTYQYVMKSYGAPSKDKESTTSVESEIALLTTAPANAKAPSIVGPNNANCLEGQDARFTVHMDMLDGYKSVAYSWETRTEGKSWETIDAKKNPTAETATLVIPKVTKKDYDGTQYRCRLLSLYGGNPVTYYSGVGTLLINQEPVTVTVSADSATGTGTLGSPYRGLATTAYTETRDDQITVYEPRKLADGKLIYQVMQTEEEIKGQAAKRYYAFDPATAAYYKANADGTALVGDAITQENKFRYYGADGVEIPGIAAFDSSPITQTVDGKQYTLKADVTTGVCREESDPTMIETRLGQTMDDVVTYYWLTSTYNADKRETTYTYYSYDAVKPNSIGELVTLGNTDNLFDVYVRDEVTDQPADPGNPDGTPPTPPTPAVTYIETYVLGRNEKFKDKNPNYTGAAGSKEHQFVQDSGYWFTKLAYQPKVDAVPDPDPNDGKNEAKPEIPAHYLATPFTVTSSLHYMAGTEDVTADLGMLEAVLDSRTETKTTLLNHSKGGSSITLKAKVTPTSTTDLIHPVYVNFILTNIQTGATNEVPAGATKNGEVSTVWVAPEPGLYAIRAISVRSELYMPGTSTELKYYDASVQSVAGNAENSLFLSSVIGTSGPQSLTGTTEFNPAKSISLELKSRPISEEGAGAWGSYTPAGSVVYKVAVPGSPKLTELGTSTSYALPCAGVFEFVAYDRVTTKELVPNPTPGTGDAEGHPGMVEKEVVTDTEVARATLNVTPRRIRIIPSFNGTPQTVEEVHLKAVELNDRSHVIADLTAALNDPLKPESGIFQITCPYFNLSDEDKKTESDRYPVTIDYVKANSDAAKKFRQNYEPLLESSMVVVMANSAQVNFTSGENGKIAGFVGGNKVENNSGNNQVNGEALEFRATPNDGYVVEKWIINGVEYVTGAPEWATRTSAAGGETLRISRFDTDRHTMTVSEGGKNYKVLNIEVYFKSAMNKVTFLVANGEGTIRAVASKGSEQPKELTSGSNVTLGSSITFTAVPAAGQQVDQWTVGEESYKNSDGTIYRENTLTIDNVQQAYTVTVSFKGESRVAVSTEVCGVDGTPDGTLGSITAHDAYDPDKTPITDLSSLTDGTSLTFTAVPAATVNNMVKEWQISTDNGRSWNTVKDSGGQESITLYNINRNMKVRVLMTIEQQYNLNWKIMLGNSECTDEAIARLSASSNGETMTEGPQNAYISADFTLTLSENYYLVNWSSNVEPGADGLTARLPALNEITSVVVTIAEKPVVNFGAETNGTITVTGTRVGQPVTIRSDTANRHVDYNSAVTVTATPAGYTDSSKASAYVVGTVQNTTCDKTNGPKTDDTLTNVTADVEVTASFLAKPQVTFAANQGNSNTLSVTGKADGVSKTLTTGDYVDFNSTVTATAAPNVDYVVDEIQSDKVNALRENDAVTKSGIDVPDAGLAVTASFQEKPVVNFTAGPTGGTVTVTATVNGKQNTNVSSGTHVDYAGQNLTVVAEPAPGYIWNHVQSENNSGKINGEKTVASVDVSAGGTVSLTADFLKKPVVTVAGTANGTVTMTASARDGAKAAITTGDYVDFGSDVTFTLTPVKGWEVDLAGTAYVDEAASDVKTYTAENLHADTELTPSWSEIPTYGISFSVVDTNGTAAGGTNGSLSARAERKALNDYGADLTSGGRVFRDSVVTLTANPEKDYRIKEWKLGTTVITSENAASLGMTLTGSALVLNDVQAEPAGEITVQFMPLGGKITAAAAANGEITGAMIGDSDKTANILGGGITIPGGVSVDFTAAPAAGYEVEGWYVTGVRQSGTEEQNTFRYLTTEGSGAHITVQFRPVMQNVTFGGVNGTVTASPAAEGGRIRGGTAVTFTAVPSEGFVLAGWTVDGENVAMGSDNTLTWTVPVTAPTSHTVQAVFTKGTYSVTLTAGAHGTADASFDPLTAVPGGTSVTFTAHPEAGYVVKSWTVDGETETTDRTTKTVVIRKTTSVSVTFDVDGAAVSFGGTHGTVTAGDRVSGSNIPGGTTVTFTAAAETGYHVTGWTVNGEAQAETGADFIWTVPIGATRSYRVEAIFERDSYTVTYSVEGGVNGTLSARVGGTDLPSGTAVTGDTFVTFLAEPADGYIVESWTVSGGAPEMTRDTSRTLHITADTVLSVRFVPAAYKVTFSAGANGSVSAPGGTETAEGSGVFEVMVPYDGSITLAARPAASYLTVDKWLLDGAEDSETGTQLTLEHVKAPHTIRVTFKPLFKYSVGYDMSANTGTSAITATATFGDTTKDLILASGVTSDEVETTKLVFTAAPDAGQMVREWIVTYDQGTPGQQVVRVDKTNMADFGMKHPLEQTLTIPSLTRATHVEVVYETLALIALPADGNGYTVRQNARMPELPGDGTHVRRNGDVTFTVAATGAFTLNGLTVNGRNLIKNTGTADPSLCDDVTAVKNEDGSYTVTVTNVKTDFAAEIQANQLMIHELGTDSPAFEEISYTDRDGNRVVLDKTAIKTRLDTGLTGAEENKVYMEIALKYYDEAEDKWKPVTEENFPAEGVDVVIDYPGRTDKTFRFTIVHVFSYSKNGKQAGDMEVVSRYSCLDDGIHFHVDSLSPFVIGWVKYTTPGGGGSGGGGGFGGGGFGGGGVVPGTRYPITVQHTWNGTVASDKEKAAEGETVTLTTTARPGKALHTLKVVTATGKAVELTDTTAGSTFVMPDEAVLVSASFHCLGDGYCPTRHLKDNPLDAWYHDAVDYVVEQSLMGGISPDTFAPEVTTTRAMIVTTLYRLENRPDVAGLENEFVDVADGMWYSDAIRWASANKVALGYGEGLFGPEDTITREQMTAILWRYVKFKGMDVSVGENTNILSFKDVEEIADWAVDSMQWACGAGLVEGSGEYLMPADGATRAQIAAILMRFCEKVLR